MKCKTAIACFSIGALLAPAASYTAETRDVPSKTRQAGDFVDDATITSGIKAAFAKDKQISAAEINVDTVNGVVTLTGHAKSKAESDKAVSIARNAPGVTEVKNMIQVSLLKK